MANLRQYLDPSEFKEEDPTENPAKKLIKQMYGPALSGEDQQDQPGQPKSLSAGDLIGLLGMIF